VGAAVAVSSLALGVASPSAKTHKTHKKVPKEAATITVKSTCKIGMTLAIPAGATDVTPPVDSGQMFGPESCSGGLGNGFASFTFTTADTGDLVGPFSQVLPTGGLTGSLDLAETNSLPPSPYAFGNADLGGTLKITGGLGADKKAKGNATFVCTTPDSIHYVCLEKAKFTLPNPA
jgi:hypothetical protein